MNPTLSRHQSLMISEESNESDVRLLLGACESYMLPRATAEQIITEVETAVSAWRELAVRLGISKREIDWFAGRMGDSFDWTIANG
jgi:serine/threonine-protein kinase HipA